MAKLATLLPLLLFLLTASLVFSRNTDREQYGEGGEHPAESEQSSNNPFFFDEKSFRTPLKTREGNLRILDRFTQRSHLLRGIEKYRLAVLEANPNAALMPTHYDTDEILFVVAGRATITLMRKENKESYNLRKGDILRVEAGTTHYIINRHNKEQLLIAKLLETMSVPGQVQPFFGIGGRNPESYYTSFSKNILEAAFNTEDEKVRKVFQENQEGAFVSVPQEKIRQIAQQASSSSEEGRTHGGRRRGPFNLFEKHPTYSNQHGQIYEVDSSDYPALQAQDISVAYAIIRGGSMLAPYYNSKAFKVALVVDGKGHWELVSPYGSARSGEGRESQEESVSYQRLSAELSDGNGLVVPPGHPSAIVAEGGQDLRVLCFGINAEENQEHRLAGRDNIYNKMNKAEREIFFKAPETEVREVLNAQRDAGIVEGPKGSQESESEGRGRAFQSILGFAGF
ncbi:Cupin 1 [Cinnamomum micranthum f. kanehirae]|uniref:Cupin 1 n=1 Tax=Cinnamomum micranthum f. kanehirae TaxID=337451 RepID=A0A3S3MZF2_9MAGN|nr:Cupin 1 [Cinnamomum micranthum f. kanehirae]